MGLNGIRNPAKLRKISALIGEPCPYAAARYFEHQCDLLAFGRSGRAFVVNLKRGTSEPYTDERVQPYIAPDGQFSGVRHLP